MQYLTVGTNFISEDLFRNITDSKFFDFIKPNGGLWLTRYDFENPNFNLWVDYMLSHLHLFFYKGVDKNVFQKPCSIVTLKDNANIFYLNSIDKYNYLVQKFPNGMGSFSYEKMVSFFDGIYIDLNFNFLDQMDQSFSLDFSKFAVSSLILFRLSCIDYYYAGIVDIEPFDYESRDFWDVIPYTIQFDQVRKFVDSRFDYSSLQSVISPCFSKIKKRNVGY